MIQRHISTAERRKMIEEAAYFRALARGFGPGDPLEDWLSAELEIDAKYRLKTHDEGQTKQFYRHLAEEVCCRELAKSIGSTVPLGGLIEEPRESPSAR